MDFECFSCQVSACRAQGGAFLSFRVNGHDSSHSQETEVAPGVMEAEIPIRGGKPSVGMVEEQFTGSASVHASATFLKVNSTAFSAFIEALGGDDQTLMQDVIYIPSAIVETTIEQTKLQGNVLTPLQQGSVVRTWRALLKHVGVAPPSLGAAMPVAASAPSTVAPVLSQSVTPSQLPQHLMMPPEETQPSTSAPPPGTWYASQDEWRTMALQGSNAVPDFPPNGRETLEAQVQLHPGARRRSRVFCAAAQNATQARGGFHTEEWRGGARV